MTFKSTKVEDIISLTPLQEGMLFHYLEDPGSDHYFEQLSLHISGKLELHYFEEAWNKVIEANEMLRTVFRWEKLTKPSQLILKEHKCRLIFYDLSDKDSGQKKKGLEEIKDSDRRENFDLHQVPFRIILCKLNEIQYEMIISSHHILYDGWSNGIILKEFFNVYHALSIGKQTLPLPAKSSFKEFIKWLQNQDKNKQERFWNDYLAEFETPTDLPIKKRKTGMAGAGYYSLVLEGKTRNQLDMFVKSYRETAASVFYTAWGILLQKYCDSEDVIFGTTISGRSANVNGIEDIVGLFINTIPLRVQFLAGLKIIDIVTYVENSLQAREEFQYTSLADIINCSTSACCPGNPRRPLFDSIVVIENYPLDNRLTPSKSLLNIDSYSMSETTHYDLTISIELFNEIKINFNYKQACFDQETIANLAGHFKRILLNIIVNPQAPFSQLEILSQEEKNQVLYEFNNTAVGYPEHKSIHQLIEEQVERTPDRIALIGSNIQITYFQFNKQSDRLAGLLMEKGVLPDHIIGLMIDRSIEMIVGLLGILKAGGAYLPIDPGYPQERIDYMLKDSAAKVLLINKSEIQNPKLETNPNKTNSNAPNKNQNSGAAFVLNFKDLNFEFVCTRNFVLRASNLFSSNLAYVIYTSGSTGKPKGAMVQMEGFFNLLCWYAREFKIKETDNILLIAPISFDLAQKNLFSPFIVGGCLTLAYPGIPDYYLLSEIIQEKQVSLINCAPSMFYPLLELNYDTGFLKLRSLRKIILGGESIQLDKLLPWANSGNYRCEIVNTYGPTECTDIATCYWLSNDGIHDRTVIPIGKPIANVKIFILDKYLNILPVMISGEVCIGGIGVSRGYCNNPTLSQEKFIEMRHHPVKILYRSGDIGRWLLDGNIEFLGRIDQQVKVRGLRIELEEIERQLLKNKNIKDAVVVTNEKEKGHNYLCAYVIVHNNDLEEAKIREYLAQHLPGYMIPTYFVKLDRIPLTPSGKVDRKSLPAPIIEAVNSYVAPRNEIE
ncbi:MAG: amino acid adenylation domain-containing protein, partial [Acidobacteria bacterium]|nr:amino acid adenylation domain-containing protein [Acidobacteriota bacterium]